MVEGLVEVLAEGEVTGEEASESAEVVVLA